MLRRASILAALASEAVRAARLPVRNVLRHGRRSAAALAAVAVGTAALIVATGFIDWMLVELRDLRICSSRELQGLIMPRLRLVKRPRF